MITGPHLRLARGAITNILPIGVLVYPEFKFKTALFDSDVPQAIELSWKLRKKFSCYLM
jgi:hypothetical protein